MHPFSFPQSMLDDMSQVFSIERDGTIIGSVHGIFCGREYPNTIQFLENADIKNGDWVIDTITGQRYFAKNARPIIMGGKPCDWMVEYETELSYQKSKAVNRQTNINIHSVTGNSIIGNQENVVMNIGNSINDIKQIIDTLPDAEQAEAHDLLKTLQTTEEATHPILVEGALSKFSDLLKKHSDLLIAVGGWAVKLLIGQ